MKNQTIIIGFFLAPLVMLFIACETRKIESINPRFTSPTIQGNHVVVPTKPVYDIIVENQRQNSISGADEAPAGEVIEEIPVEDGGDVVEVGDPNGASDPSVVDIPGLPLDGGAGLVPPNGGMFEPPPFGPGFDDIEDDADEDDDGPFVVGVCGDGKRSITEQCDDGNTDNTDGCNVLCKFPVCGNGVVEKNEACDDGNSNNNDGCSTKCMYEKCGNGILDPNEQCDDGNTDSGDGCSKSCTREVCGNSIIDAGETCDDGNKTNGDGCSQYCQLEICGNGVITPNEQCDDGNRVSGDGCSSNCTLETPAKK